MVLRIKVNNLCSSAGIVIPTIDKVIAINCSRVRILNSALTRVTYRGTNVVGPGMPMIVNQLPRTTQRAVVTSTRRGRTPLCRGKQRFATGGVGHRRLGGRVMCSKLVLRHRQFRLKLTNRCRISGTTITLAVTRLCLGQLNIPVSIRTFRGNLTGAH